MRLSDNKFHVGELAGLYIHPAVVNSIIFENKPISTGCQIAYRKVLLQIGVTADMILLGCVGFNLQGEIRLAGV